MDVRPANAGSAHTNTHLTFLWGWAAGLDYCKRVWLFDGYREHCRPSMKRARLTDTLQLFT